MTAESSSAPLLNQGARSPSKPAAHPAGSEVRFFGDERFGRFLESPRRLRTAQKIHVDSADLIVAELHIARALTPVRVRGRRASKTSDDPFGDSARRSFGEDARLRSADAVDVTHRIDA